MELKDRRFILIDIETTGFDCKKHQILEIGVLCIEDGEVIGSLLVPIKHKEYTISIKAMEANKIDLIEHDKTAYGIGSAIELILEFLKEYEMDDRFIVVGQNVDFDIRFLEELFLKEFKIKELRKYVGYRKLDIMQLALIKNIEGKLKIEKQDLDYLLETLEIEIPENRHRALADCYLEFEVLKKLLNK